MAVSASAAKTKTTKKKKPRRAASPGIGDAAVRRATGMGWSYWFGVLDRFGRTVNDHAAVAAYLVSTQGLPGWWAQMITVGWERARGGRRVGETTRGFEVGVSRTVHVPVKKAFEAWSTSARMSRWFMKGTKLAFRKGGRYSNAAGDRGVFKRIVPGKRIRFTWEHPKHGTGSVVEVIFAGAGSGACRVTVTHAKLRTRRERDAFKAGWARALDSYRSYLETGKGSLPPTGGK